MPRLVRVCAGVVLSVIILVGFPVCAHKPLSFEGVGDADEALYVERIDVSQVVYYKLTVEEKQLVLAFDKQAGKTSICLWASRPSSRGNCGWRSANGRSSEFAMCSSFLQPFAEFERSTRSPGSLAG